MEKLENDSHKPARRSAFVGLAITGVIFVGSLVMLVAFLLQSGSSELGQADLSSQSVNQPVDPRVKACLVKAQIASSGLPLPSQLKSNEFQPRFYEFLRSFKYRKLNWVHDKRIRDTGNYAKGMFNGSDYNGTHPAIAIYYSPEIYCWLLAGRQGGVPDGAMIIKEMYPPPAARYEGQALDSLVTPWWTTMVKDAVGSHDGWYWSELFDSVDAHGARTDLQKYDHEHPREYPDSGFGSYCVRCHASAERDLTFSSLHNIEEDLNIFTGKREKFGHPLNFLTNENWKNAKSELREEYYRHSPHMIPMFHDPARKFASARSTEPTKLNETFSKMFGAIFPSVERSDVQEFPADTFDHQVQSTSGHQYLTSDQCMSCHAGDNSPFGPNMFLQNAGHDGKGVDLSPWGEWRWSMMGLAGRDPIFFAQLETEMTKFQNATGALTPAVIADTCLNCHGAMGQHQAHLDMKNGKYHGADGKNLFSLTDVFSHNSYGALARDGVSCTICHQISDNSTLPLKDVMTGAFEIEPRKNGKNQIFGPYKEVRTKPMEASIAALPKYSAFLGSSRMCATCHTIHLPAADATGTVKKAVFEQTTYLEWLNSSYADHGATPKSCQQCHMPDHYKDEKTPDYKLNFKIANIQDQDFPFGAHDNELLQSHGLLSPMDINVPKRSEIKRHTLNGINAFALEFFNQFSDILGRRKQNYMVSTENDLENTIDHVQQFARNETAKVEILDAHAVKDHLIAKVRVTNLTGHRFPSGVGFRRAFLALTVSSGGKVLWRSGGTNNAGVIVDSKGNVLDTEFFTNGAFQPHHQLITSDKQVQIYQELVQDDKNQFTTSFLSIFKHVKDNRLLPKGWSTHPTGDPTVDPEFFEATRPVGEAADDADFTSGKGEDIVDYDIPLPAHSGAVTVSTRLYYQSIPPSYLKQRFESAKGPATQRLFYLASHLETEGTPVKGWKLLVGADDKDVQ